MGDVDCNDGFYPHTSWPVIVHLPKGYRQRFTNQAVKRGKSEDESVSFFQDFIGMCGRHIPKDTTPEDAADFWLEEEVRCS